MEKDLLPNYYEYLKANAATILNGTSFNQALYNGFNAGETLQELYLTQVEMLQKRFQNYKVSKLLN